MPDPKSVNSLSFWYHTLSLIPAHKTYLLTGALISCPSGPRPFPSFQPIDLLVDRSLDSLSLWSQTLSFLPAHLLQHLETHVLASDLEFLVIWHVRLPAFFQCLQKGRETVICKTSDLLEHWTKPTDNEWVGLKFKCTFTHKGGIIIFILVFGILHRA